MTACRQLERYRAANALPEQDYFLCWDSQACGEEPWKDGSKYAHTGWSVRVNHCNGNIVMIITGCVLAN